MTELLMPDQSLVDAMVRRAARPDFGRFEAQLKSSGYCARPVRLKGWVETCDGRGGRRRVWDTSEEPDGVLRKACGNRREAVCVPCAERYRQDAYHLIAAGLRGGKGVPETIAGHPAVFVTLTAPSFGVVHSRRYGPDGEPRRCRPRRDAPVCPHGVALSCTAIHEDDDPCLGEPLCLDCYDHAGAVLWNNALGELWRRTTIYVPRHLAAACGMTQKRLRGLVRPAYAKVAEYQRRGLVHLHVVYRLDRAMPDYRADQLRQPDARFDVDLLTEAIRGAVDAVRAPLPDVLGGGEVTWGDELEVRPISDHGNGLSVRRCAGYLAKYATKSTELAGGLLHRIGAEEVEYAPVSEHVRCYMRAAFELHEAVETAAEAQRTRALVPAEAAVDPTRLALRVLHAMSCDERVSVRLADGREVVGRIVQRTATELVLDTGEVVALDQVRAVGAAPLPAKRSGRDEPRFAACAHALGYRGHCLTKSRRFSTTFTALRHAREQHVRERLLQGAAGDSQRCLAETLDDDRIAVFIFDGIGHDTTADAFLAASAENRAREERRIAREELRALSVGAEP
jgi:Replication initiator protein, pSAM2